RRDASGRRDRAHPGLSGRLTVTSDRARRAPEHRRAIRPKGLKWPRPKRGDVPKWLRERSAKPLFGGSNPPVASKAAGAMNLERPALGWDVGSRQLRLTSLFLTSFVSGFRPVRSADDGSGPRLKGLARARLLAAAVALWALAFGPSLAAHVTNATNPYLFAND